MRQLFKNPLFYTNLLLFLIAVFLAANLAEASLPGFLSGWVRTVRAAIATITGEGNVSYLPKFAGGANPSNQIGDSIIYDNGTNIGIGTTNPGAKLDVAGDVAINRNYIYLAGAGDTNHAIHNISATDGEQFRFWNFLDLYQANGGASRLYINNAGNVGIGTVSPGVKLDVNGAINIRDRGDGCCAQLVQSANGGYSTHFYTYSDGRFQIHKYGTGSPSGSTFTITNAGNVGIGVTSPGFKLDVARRIRLRQAGDSSAGLWLYQDTPAADRAFIGMAGDNEVGLWGNTGAAWGLLMNTSNGNVGIKATGGNPATRLHIGDGGDGWGNGLTIHSNYPTIYLRDADNRSAFIHVNSDIFYILSGCANGSDPYSGNTWCQNANSRWPLYLNLNNNNAIFGGDVNVKSLTLDPLGGDPGSPAEGMMWMR